MRSLKAEDNLEFSIFFLWHNIDFFLHNENMVLRVVVSYFFIVLVLFIRH